MVCINHHIPPWACLLRNRISLTCTIMQPRIHAFIEWIDCMCGLNHMHQACKLHNTCHSTYINYLCASLLHISSSSLNVRLSFSGSYTNTVRSSSNTAICLLSVCLLAHCMHMRSKRTQTHIEKRRVYALYA